MTLDSCKLVSQNRVSQRLQGQSASAAIRLGQDHLEEQANTDILKLGDDIIVVQ